MIGDWIADKRQLLITLLFYLADRLNIIKNSGKFLKAFEFVIIVITGN